MPGDLGKLPADLEVVVGLVNGMPVVVEVVVCRERPTLELNGMARATNSGMAKPEVCDYVSTRVMKSARSWSMTPKQLNHRQLKPSIATAILSKTQTCFIFVSFLSPVSGGGD